MTSSSPASGQVEVVPMNVGMDEYILGVSG